MKSFAEQPASRGESTIIQAQARFAARQALTGTLRQNGGDAQLHFLHSVQPLASETSAMPPVDLPAALQTFTTEQQAAFDELYAAISSTHGPTQKAYRQVITAAHEAGRLPESLYQFCLDALWLNGNGADDTDR